MKIRIIMMAMLLAVSISVTACSAKQNESSTISSSSSTSSSSEAETPSSEEETKNWYEENRDFGVVMDAAMYRGTITKIEDGKEAGSKVFTLEQYEGTNFGNKTLQFIVNDSTRTNIENNELAEGMFVEMYYGASVDGTTEEPVTAIVIKKMPEAEMIYINTEIISVTKNTDGTGTILSKRISAGGAEGGEEIAINFSSETQMYINLDEASEGDKINVLITGPMTRSLPPQVFALEIGEYSSAENM